MRILHIMASNALGGAETYSTDVMLSLQREGVDQCVVMAKKAPRYAELEKAGLRMTSWVLVVPFLPLQKILLHILIWRERPDIVQSWMRRGAALAGGSSQLFAKQEPSPHNPAQIPLPLREGLGVGLFEQDKPSTVGSGGNNPTPNPSRKGRGIRSLLRRGQHAHPVAIGWFGGYYDPTKFRNCAHLVGVTKDIVAHMVKNGVPRDRAHFIPVFPDIAALPPIDRAALSTPRAAKVLLTLSRLHPKKGLDVLLRSLQDLPDCVVWLAGDGPLRRELETLAKQLGVIDRVRFLGWRTDRAALLRAADICVFPSRYEPFGAVILEAWAAQTPLVACASAGPAAHVEDGETGLLTPIDDAAALRDAIRRALDDAELRRHLITQGYAAYIKTYTPEAVTRQWLEFYRGLVG